MSTVSTSLSVVIRVDIDLLNLTDPYLDIHKLFIEIQAQMMIAVKNGSSESTLTLTQPTEKL